MTLKLAITYGYYMDNCNTSRKYNVQCGITNVITQKQRNMSVVFVFRILLLGCRFCLL